MDQSAPSPEDFMRAERVVDHMLQNLAIEYQVAGSTMSLAEAEKHFNQRATLVHAKKMLLDEGERVLRSQS